MSNKITDNIFQIGVNDEELTLFEGQYILEHGMSYNSYVIKDQKNVLLDTIDERVTNKWLKELEEVLEGESLDYLVVSHMEPDHAYNVGMLAKKFPEMKIVGNNLTFNMLNNFFEDDFSKRKLVVMDGDILDIGEHKLKFIMAPMVHWPEVMLTYEQSKKILFSADAFGRFGVLNSKEEWEKEARRYYFGIVGKYGAQVQTVLKKATNLDIKTICPLHGPVLEENLEYYLQKYNTWSSYEPEEEGVCLVCSSIYGNTLRAVKELASILQNEERKVKVIDLTKEDWAEAVANAFCYSSLVVASSSYNAGVFPPMLHFLQALKERNYQNRKVAIIENGSWAPSAGKGMKAILQEMKNINLVEPIFTIKSKLKEENKKALLDWAKNI